MKLHDKKRLRLQRATATIAVLFALFSIPGCGQENSINDPATFSFMKARFPTGDAIMACERDCIGRYGYNRMALQQLYETQDWNNLADKLLTIGDDNDQSWFYLASAAQGLGYDDAAQKYYFRSLSAHFRCKGALNLCDGLDLPALTEARLEDLDHTLETTPEFAQLSAPVSPATSATKIQMVNNHGILLVPGRIDGKIPLIFAIDSGASTVNIPLGVALLLLHMGALKKDDFIARGAVEIGNGAMVPTIIFKIESLRVGNVTVENVTGSISNGSGPVLLGQSFLTHFSSWSIDNAHGVLVLQ